MITMDFTTTAMARPDIVGRTYASFSKNLQGINLKECTLFINIDPLPEGVDRKEVVKTAEKYFKTVHANFPKKPNYTSAYNWIWSQATTEYIFNLEDDWELKVPVSIPKLLGYFKKHPALLEVALRAYPYLYDKCPTSPSIMHKRYYKAVAGKLNPKFNPESQLRGENFGIKMPAPSLGVPWKGKVIAYPESGKVILKDIGRAWMKKSNYMKPKIKKNRFTAWVKK